MIERKDKVSQGNCFEVYMNGSLFAVVHSEVRAVAVIHAMASVHGGGNTDPYYYGLAWHAGINF